MRYFQFKTVLTILSDGRYYILAQHMEQSSFVVRCDGSDPSEC